jgi:hypothetical protein
VDLAAELDRLSREAPREDLPSLLGRLAEAEARIRIRLADVPTVTPPPPSRVIDGEEMATIAGTSKRLILARTRGMRFRCDLSRKQPRADEAGFRRWFTGGAR